MSAAMPPREDLHADDLRQLARASRDAGQSRRLLALATIYEGGSRMDAARTGAVSLQTVRDWVLAFNAAGPAGLFDRKAQGQRPKLDAAQWQALARTIEDGSDPERHDVMRWRLKDLVAWVIVRPTASLLLVQERRNAHRIRRLKRSQAVMVRSARDREEGQRASKHIEIRRGRSGMIGTILHPRRTPGTRRAASCPEASAARQGGMRYPACTDRQSSLGPLPHPQREGA